MIVRVLVTCLDGKEMMPMRYLRHKNLIIAAHADSLGRCSTVQRIRTDLAYFAPESCPLRSVANRLSALLRGGIHAKTYRRCEQGN